MGHVGGNEGVTDGQPDERPPRLLDEVRRVLWLRHYSLRTEHACVSWIRRFILANGKRHPRETGASEVERFLSTLAVDRRVSAGTQNQALAALLFLYREVLGVELPCLDSIVLAKRPRGAESAGLLRRLSPFLAASVLREFAQNGVRCTIPRRAGNAAARVRACSA
jgi:hypothetical protein